MVKTYQRTDSVQLSKNFKLDEFKCKCRECNPILVDTDLVEWLQKIRDHFGKSVHINSGYRCEKHNEHVGGSKSSHHKRGMAADIRVQGITPEEVAKYAESIGIQRIGLYDTFVHIGSNTTKKYWLDHVGTRVETFGGAPEKTVSIDVTVLKRGMKGDKVGALQLLLIGYGYNIAHDDSFGSRTEEAVKDYQREHGLDADGSVGAKTWASLLGL